jgi:Domain of unknown function (DUF4269)
VHAVARDGGAHSLTVSGPDLIVIDGIKPAPLMVLPDLDGFVAILAREFGQLPRFEIGRIVARAVPSVVCTFTFAGWEIEIFGQNVPVAAQYGVRHFKIERRVLALLGPDFRARVIALRMTGLKTEPAFAWLLGLTGDPYDALLELEGWTDDRLAAFRLPARGDSSP